MASTDLSKLLDLLTSLTNLYFSNKKQSRKQYKTSSLPWITKDLLNQIKQKNKLYSRFLKTKSNAIFLKYKKCRNKLTHAKELSEGKYYQSLFSSIDTSSAWTHINSNSKKNRKSSATLLSSLNDQGKVLHDPNKLCNAINHYFENIGNKIAPPVLVKKEDYYYHPKKRQCKSIKLNPSDDYEIIEAINILNCHKSTGYIDLPLKLIKHAKFIIASYLSRSFNFCIEKGYYPDQLKIAKVVPLYKNGNKTDVGNYRPISILSPINKVFETLLHETLIAYWEKFNLFTNHQFGFRKKNIPLTLLSLTTLKRY